MENDGLGLAAPQCGISYQVFVMGTKENKQIMYNPVILSSADEKIADVEGCLSYPGLIIKVPRPTAVQVKWQHVDGKVMEGKFTGLTARIIQHEIAHLQGVLFWEGVGKTTLAMARDKRTKYLKKLERR